MCPTRWRGEGRAARARRSAGRIRADAYMRRGSAGSGAGAAGGGAADASFHLPRTLFDALLHRASPAARRGGAGLQARSREHRDRRRAPSLSREGSALAACPAHRARIGLRGQPARAVVQPCGRASGAFGRRPLAAGSPARAARAARRRGRALAQRGSASCRRFLARHARRLLLCAHAFFSGRFHGICYRLFGAGSLAARGEKKYVIFSRNVVNILYV